MSLQKAGNSFLFCSFSLKEGIRVLEMIDLNSLDQNIDYVDALRTAHYNYFNS